MVLLALLLVASASSITVVDEVFSLAPGEVKTVNLSLHQRPAVVDAAFKVTSGDSVVSLGLRGPDGSAGAASRRFLRVMHEQSAGALWAMTRCWSKIRVITNSRPPLRFRSASLLARPARSGPRRFRRSGAAPWSASACCFSRWSPGGPDAGCWPL